MITTYFKEITTGRLKRLPYIGYHLLLSFIMLAIMIGIGISAGVFETAVDDPEAVMEAWGAALTGGLAIVVMLIGAVVVFAGANIAAKRLRDMGLPGWLALLGILVASALVNYFANQGIQGLFSLAIMLFMWLVPSDTFGGNKSAKAEF